MLIMYSNVARQCYNIIKSEVNNMGNQKYIVQGRICPKCGAENVEFSNFGDTEIEKCLSCGHVLE